MKSDQSQVTEWIERIEQIPTFGAGTSEGLLIPLSLSALFISCLSSVLLCRQIHLNISSHAWMYCLLIGQCVFVSSEC